MTRAEIASALEANRGLLITVAVRYSRADAQDIVQETCLRALTCDETLLPERGNEAAWLASVCTRMALDMKRQERQRHMAELRATLTLREENDDAYT